LTVVPERASPKDEPAEAEPLAARSATGPAGLSHTFAKRSAKKLVVVDHDFTALPIRQQAAARRASI